MLTDAPDRMFMTDYARLEIDRIKYLPERLLFGGTLEAVSPLLVRFGRRVLRRIPWTSGRCGCSHRVRRLLDVRGHVARVVIAVRIGNHDLVRRRRRRYLSNDTAFGWTDDTTTGRHADRMMIDDTGREREKARES